MIIPDLTDEQLGALRSAGEARVYRALRSQLPREYLVLFQVGWILRKENERAKDGETDFVICHPDAGYLCIEVKGGGIGFNAENDNWYSIDRHGQRHEINNPIGQSLRAKYSIGTKLSEDRRWRAIGVTNAVRGHAVFFPDVGSTGQFSRPDMPRALIGSTSDLENIKIWVDSAFQYWRNIDKGIKSIGPKGVAAIKEIFAKSFEVKPLIASSLREQDAKRLILTNDQIRVLDFIRSHRRVAISGGAGTGKTVLAIEKAKRLALEGFKTLLTCYNRQLANFLKSACADVPNLEVISFHQLCHRRIEAADGISGRSLLSEAKLTYPGKDLFDVQLPNALMYSVDVLNEPYDAIVCDEGQDFREEYWLPLELLLKSSTECPFYIFYDDNQNLYKRTSNFPVPGIAFSLTSNCRNTDQIHDAAYALYAGSPVTRPNNPGEDVQRIGGANQFVQASNIHNRIVQLITKEGIAARDIVVLIMDGRKKFEFYSLLKRKPLPGTAAWAEETESVDGRVLLETVQRFKGLESPIVFLWDSASNEDSRELSYVGLSRAKSLLFVVGEGVLPEGRKD